MKHVVFLFFFWCPLIFAMSEDVSKVKIVTPSIRETLVPECIVGLRDVQELEKAIEHVNFNNNDPYLHQLEGIVHGVKWLRTGQRIPYHASKNDDVDQLHKKILADWNRIMHEYLERAIEQSDWDIIQTMLCINFLHKSAPVAHYYTEISEFVLSKVPEDVANRIRSDVQQIQSPNRLINEEISSELIVIETESGTIASQDKNEDLEDDSFEEKEIYSATQINWLQRTCNWIKNHPVVSVSSIVAVCGGVYAYLKKAETKKNKKSKKGC